MYFTFSCVWKAVANIIYRKAFYHKKPPAVACSDTKCRSVSVQTDYSPQCQYLWAKVLQVPVGPLSWLFSFSTRSTPQFIIIIITTLPSNPCWMVSGHWVYCTIHSTKSTTVIFFVCDVADTITAGEVVQPLLSGILPTLRECNIRLNKHVNPAMNRIAHRAGRYAMGHSALMTETPSSFPFFALPWELRRQVLQYTDLLTPFHEF